MLQQTIEKLHTLHLSAFADALRDQAQQPDIQALPFEERLAILVDLQHCATQTAALNTRLRRAGMRQSASFENLDLRTPRGLDRSTMQALGSGQWIRQNLNILITGPSGIGKSWIACALGNRAARDGFSVLYRRLSRLLDELAVARLHGRQARLLTSLARTRLLVIDDWMMIKLTAEQRRDLMEVIDDRHGRASTLLATQIPVERWHDQIGDPTYADAILDRLVHNAYRLALTGKSMRPRLSQRADAAAPDATDGTAGQPNETLLVVDAG
jgi:DNA replication protein DnaC